nr:hypothetical protein [Tanacetum cinerariifolium]
MLVEALESGLAFDKQQMTFLVDNRDTITTCQTSQELVTTTAFQTDDLDAFDSDCDEAPLANVVLMAKLCMYDSDVLSEIILIGLSEDIYVVVDSCDTTQEIWLRVEQIMKGSDIGAQEKKAKNKHFSEKISNNLKFLNHLQLEWKRHITTVHQTKNRYEVDYNQLYDFLNQEETYIDSWGNGGYQFRQYAGKNARNQIRYNVGQITGNKNGYNAPQNARNLVFHNLVHNMSIQNVRNQNRLIVVLEIANQNANQNGNDNVVAARVEDNGNRNNGDIDKIDEVNAKCILMANLQKASTSVKPTTRSYLVQQNNNNVILEDSSMPHSRGTIEQHSSTVEETRAYFESLYNNSAIEVKKVNTVNHKMKEVDADLTTELERYKGQEMCFEFNQEKFDELENGFKMSVYQEQCLTKNINALHLI